MQKLAIFYLGTLAVLPLCSYGAANVDFSSGKFSSDGLHMATGQNGHAQAVLDGQGSLIRFGSNTVIDLGNEREVTLGKGLLLVSSGEGFLRRSGVVIHTPEGQIAIRGTVLVAVLPDGAVKLTCLEGSVRGELGGRDFSLHPGELIVQRSNGTRDVVQVNLNALTHTCTLLSGGGFKPLHFAGNIDQAAVQQDKALAAVHHQAGGQHGAAGHGQGEPTGFFGRLFSGHSNDSNNLSSSGSGSVSGVTMTLRQGGGDNSALTISNGSITFSGNAMIKSGPGGDVGRLVVGSSVGGAALTAGSSVPQLVLSGSGGTSLQINGAGSVTAQSATPIVSGATLTQVSGATLTISGGQAGQLTLGNAATLNPTVIITSPGGVQGGSAGGASPP